MDEHRESTILTLGIVFVMLYVWMRLTQRAAEAVVPPLMRRLYPSVRSVIDRAEAITREAAEGGS